jgi:hypothetical protein
MQLIELYRLIERDSGDRWREYYSTIIGVSTELGSSNENVGLSGS